MYVGLGIGILLGLLIDAVVFDVVGRKRRGLGEWEKSAERTENVCV